jgi:uncharacterized protein (UPF0333 family)
MEILPQIPTEFHLLCVAVGLALIGIGNYFQKLQYENAGLLILGVGLCLSAYVWYEKHKPRRVMMRSG